MILHKSLHCWGGGGGNSDRIKGVNIFRIIHEYKRFYPIESALVSLVYVSILSKDSLTIIYFFIGILQVVSLL